MNGYIPIDGVEIPGVLDAVSNPYNCEISALSIDMRNSSGQKFAKSGIAWTSEFLKTLQVLDTHRAKLGAASVVKFEGDGILVITDSDAAHHLINMAVDVLEDIEQISTATNGSPTGLIDLKLSAAVATGEGFRFRPEQGGIEHLSAVIDRACRLCSVASPGALFIDTHTVNAANMRQVRSKFGHFVHRTPEQYLGERQSVQLRGLPDPQEYFEISWGTQLFGVRSSTVTEITAITSARRDAAVELSRQPAQAADRSPSDPGQHVGRVASWGGKGFGFVTDNKTGEQFYFSDASLIYEEDRQHLAVGAELVFLASPAPEQGRRRLATAVVVVGQEADGRISYIHPEKPFGFAALEDDRGRMLKFHLSMPAHLRSALAKGDEVSFKVGLNAVGARAVNVEPIRSGDDAAA